MNFWNQIKKEMAGDCPAIIALLLFIITLMVWAVVIRDLIDRP